MTMSENGPDIQTISAKRADKQADRVLLLGQVIVYSGDIDPPFRETDPLIEQKIRPSVETEARWPIRQER